MCTSSVAAGDVIFEPKYVLFIPALILVSDIVTALVPIITCPVVLTPFITDKAVFLPLGLYIVALS